ncbi:uncharacterized protein [Linepithema humile]|uniref:uncharacterized protein isoform X2 n=1 Tax=Linepithema humile TaxID=83485 RepID=UPI00062308A8|nr:PREDICTED: uncharacterized protein LOC105669681 isoform X1 [Linepithema humile]XP_012218180.1 PREDICTED: uncharacterized protein LOC105669681 isoform X1 [Linepithema humile]
MVMAAAIQHGLRLFLLIRFIIGLGVYPIQQPKSKIRRIVYLSILYSLIIWFSYGYFFYYVITFFPLRVLFFTIINIVVHYITIFITFTSVIINFYYEEKFQMCMKRLAAVDDTLEKLGSPKIYRRMHMLSKRMIIGWIVYTFVSNFYDTYWWLKKEKAPWGLILGLILNFCFHINTFEDLLFLFLLWYIGTRFDKVNKNVRCLLIKENHELRCTWKKSTVSLHRYVNYKQTLWTSMHLHLELCRIARELNLLFGVQMTVEMASYLFFISALCYFFYIMIQEQHNKISLYYRFDNIFWISLSFIRVAVISFICENVTVKANKIGKVIHQLTNSLRYTDVSKEICQFALQTMQHPLKFNGMNLFCFGNVFLQKFCTMIVTFVIITIQVNIYVNLPYFTT